MTYLVEVRYTGGDWADLMADMRSWLDRRQIDTEEFNYSSLGQALPFGSAFTARSKRRRLQKRLGAGCNLGTLAEPPSSGECPARRVARLIRLSQRRRQSVRHL
jgi:hypothetical protein